MKKILLILLSLITITVNAQDSLTTRRGKLFLGTTIGTNLLGLTNPAAVTFPRFNADNSISSLSASAMLTALGGGSGISGLTTNTIPKATSSTAIGNSLLTDDGTTLTYTSTVAGVTPSLLINTTGLYPFQALANGPNVYASIGVGASLNNAGAFNYTQNGVNSTTNTFGIGFNANFNILTIEATGRLGINNTTPTAWLHLPAGTASAGRAPLKITAGTNLSTTEAGAIENDGTHLYYTAANAGTRYQLDQQIPTGTGVVATARLTGQTSAASLTTYNVPAADASYLISANILVTTATLHNFTCTVTYFDETNTSRVVTLNFSTLGGTLTTAIANAGGAAPYEGVPLHIRCKASTTIVVATTGTLSTVVYNFEEEITKLN